MGFTQVINAIRSVFSRQASVAKNTGNVFYVKASIGTDGSGYGTLPTAPFATIDYAVGQCTASQGDIIYVMENHAEHLTGAAALAIDVAGISIIGLGQGANRPTLTLSSTSTTIMFNAVNCLFRNFRLFNASDSHVVFIGGAANGATIEDVDFVTASTKEALCGINIPTTYDDWTIRRCRFIQPTDPAGTNGAAGTGAIYMEDSENVLIEDCEFRGNWETACVHNKTTAAANLWVKGCYGHTGTATTDMLPFVLVSTASGGARLCHITNVNEAATTEATLSGTFGASFFNFQSFFGNDGGGGQNAIASQSAAS